jgi:hypothetical protein
MQGTVGCEKDDSDYICAYVYHTPLSKQRVGTVGEEVAGRRT